MNETMSRSIAVVCYPLACEFVLLLSVYIKLKRASICVQPSQELRSWWVWIEEWTWRW